MKLDQINVRVLSSAALVAAALALPQAARASWGCEVLLCLANPAGPMAAPACVPPITRLYKAIFKAKPDPFPTCTMVDGSNSATSGNYASLVSDSYYDPCPTGLTALPTGTYGATGTYVQRTSFYPFGPGYEISSRVLVGFGESMQPDSSGDNGSSPLLPKACVGAKVGESVYFEPTNPGEPAVVHQVNLYSPMVVQNPATTTYKFNIFVDNKLLHSVRPGF